MRADLVEVWKSEKKKQKSAVYRTIPKYTEGLKVYLSENSEAEVGVNTQARAMQMSWELRKVYKMQLPFSNW